MNPEYRRMRRAKSEARKKEMMATRTHQPMTEAQKKKRDQKIAEKAIRKSQQKPLTAEQLAAREQAITRRNQAIARKAATNPRKRKVA